jgi:hypothetical protein
MDQKTRLTLVKYLYYLAKCYEYAALRPIVVEYQVTSVFNKLTELLAGPDIGKELTQLTGTVVSVFESELSSMADELTANFVQDSKYDLEIRLSADETPEVVRQLNETGEAVINLREFNCILPGAERVRIEDVKVVALDLETTDGSTPTSGSVWFTPEPTGDGTMRAGNAWYVVRHPTSASSAAVKRDSQQIWGVTYHCVGMTVTSPIGRRAGPPHFRPRCNGWAVLPSVNISAFEGRPRPPAAQRRRWRAMRPPSSRGPRLVRIPSRSRSSG